MTTTWTITQLDRQTSNGFVTTAHWTASAVDGDYSASTYSTSSWANGVDKEAVEASLQAQIDAQKNPVSATGVPW